MYYLRITRYLSPACNIRFLDQQYCKKHRQSRAEAPTVLQFFDFITYTVSPPPTLSVLPHTKLGTSQRWRWLGQLPVSNILPRPAPLHTLIRSVSIGKSNGSNETERYFYCLYFGRGMIHSHGLDRNHKLRESHSDEFWSRIYKTKG
jgi:hypothetical protein